MLCMKTKQDVDHDRLLIKVAADLTQMVESVTHRLHFRLDAASLVVF